MAAESYIEGTEVVEGPEASEGSDSNATRQAPIVNAVSSNVASENTGSSNVVSENTGSKNVASSNEITGGRSFEKDSFDERENFRNADKITLNRAMTLVAMAFLWTGSQIPVYFFGAVPPLIYGDIGGSDRWIWFILANLLSLAGICPFVGSLSDILGRRYGALLGAALLTIGMIVCSTAKVMNIFIGGMAISGIGAGISELTALAVTSEVAPTAKRGVYVAALVFTILPFCPSVLWAQLLSSTSKGGWRWCGVVCGLWVAIGFFMTLIFYFPPPRVNTAGLSRRDLFNRIDFVGGFLSISGMILFMCGMQWGGYQYSWKSAHVLVPLFLGAFLLLVFVLWEMFYAKYPMFPSRLRQAPRILGITFLITFISGANFFSIIMFWPTQAYNMYGHDPIGIGLRGLPTGISVLIGAVLVLCSLSYFRGRNRALMVISSIFMTVGTGCLAVATRNNVTVVYPLLAISGLGIGGIVVPASIITTIITPSDLIATSTALTLAIRVLGGSVGYCIYYNVFLHKFIPAAIRHIGGAMVFQLGIHNITVITEAIELTGAGLIGEIKNLDGIKGINGAWETVVIAGQDAYAESYKWVYLVSTVFGGICVIAAAFLGDISSWMDETVAVVMK